MTAEYVAAVALSLLWWVCILMKGKHVTFIKALRQSKLCLPQCHFLFFCFFFFYAIINFLSLDESYLTETDCINGPIHWLSET